MRQCRHLAHGTGASPCESGKVSPTTLNVGRFHPTASIESGRQFDLADRFVGTFAPVPPFDIRNIAVMHDRTSQ